MRKIILIFAIIALLRSIAPERTEGIVRNIIRANRPQFSTITKDEQKDNLEKEKKKIYQMRDQLEREKLALNKLKQSLNQQIDTNNINIQESQQSIKSADEITINVIPNDPDAFSDPINNDQDLVVDQINQGNISEIKGGEDMESIGILGDEECPTIMIPEFSRAGLGIQIDHLWTCLSLTLAIRNACVVLPPIISNDEDENFASIPFYQVFDLNELALTGLKFVSLSTCQNQGVSRIFDDNGSESAIVKNFARFVNNSHPHLYEKTSLINNNTKGFRFQSEEEILYNINIAAKYVKSKALSNNQRDCIGIGRMKADITFNDDVIEHFKSARSIREYVNKKLPNGNESMFIKIRGNGSECEGLKEEENKICILSKKNILTEHFVYSIAYSAERYNVDMIYISTPWDIEENVSMMISQRLIVHDPILLDVEGDLFTAKVIERELAIRSKLFVWDGGKWGENVEESRRLIYKQVKKQGMTTEKMVERWQEEGSSTSSRFLKGSVLK